MKLQQLFEARKNNYKSPLDNSDNFEEVHRLAVKYPDAYITIDGPKGWNNTIRLCPLPQVLKTKYLNTDSSAGGVYNIISIKGANILTDSNLDTSTIRFIFTKLEEFVISLNPKSRLDIDYAISQVTPRDGTITVDRILSYIRNVIDGGFPVPDREVNRHIAMFFKLCNYSGVLTKDYHHNPIVVLYNIPKSYRVIHTIKLITNHETIFNTGESSTRDKNILKSILFEKISQSIQQQKHIVTKILSTQPDWLYSKTLYLILEKFKPKYGDELWHEAVRYFDTLPGVFLDYAVYIGRRLPKYFEDRCLSDEDEFYFETEKEWDVFVTSLIKYEKRFIPKDG